MLKFLNALAALAAVGTFVIAFLDSYEVRFKVRRRTRGADGRRHLRRNKRKYGLRHERNLVNSENYV